MDLIDDPKPGQNTPEYSVSEISGALKRTIEDAFGRIRVRGEVGRVFRARSGHLYYDIKDAGNVLACTTWKGQLARLSLIPEEGMEVIVTGRLTTFGAQSKYNMNVDEVTVAGEGALMAMLEKRKKALAAEGLFAAERKRPLPYLPGVIGVVTSPSGAVIRDILHRLRDRFPRHVLIWPVAVQGQNCAPEVTRAIEGFNALPAGGPIPRPDLLIVARGGGSIEDLWGFNEESVARAAAASRIPLISAVGHETDTTLIDYAADKRAPTPTAAAEMAVPVRLDLIAWLDGQSARLTRGAVQALAQRRQRLRDLARALPRPETLVAGARQRLDLWGDRLPGALRGVTQTKRLALARASAALHPSILRRPTERARARLEAAAPRLSAAPIRRDIARKRRDLDLLAARHARASQTRLSTARDRLTGLERMRATLSYRATLKRGFAVVRAGDVLITTRAAAAAARAPLDIEFADGRFPTAGDEATPAPKPRAKPAPRKAGPKSDPPDQGSLF